MEFEPLGQKTFQTTPKRSLTLNSASALDTDYNLLLHSVIIQSVVKMHLDYRKTFAYAAILVWPERRLGRRAAAIIC